MKAVKLLRNIHMFLAFVKKAVSIPIPGDVHQRLSSSEIDSWVPLYAIPNVVARY